MYHRKAVILMVLDAVDNLRSLVSRNAINCLGDFFTKTGKNLDSELDYIVRKRNLFSL